MTFCIANYIHCKHFYSWVNSPIYFRNLISKTVNYIFFPAIPLGQGTIYKTSGQFVFLYYFKHNETAGPKVNLDYYWFAAFFLDTYYFLDCFPTILQIPKFQNTLYFLIVSFYIKHLKLESFKYNSSNDMLVNWTFPIILCISFIHWKYTWGWYQFFGICEIMAVCYLRILR